MRCGIIDSGRGGQYVYDYLTNLYPNTKFILSIPETFQSYGSCSLENLCIESHKHIKYLEEEGVDIIIIGCMTLSVNCLNYIKYITKIKKVYDLYTTLPVYGKDTLIIATNNTIKSGNFNFLTNSTYRNNQVSGGHLAAAIENKVETSVIKNLIYEALDKSNTSTYNSVILGCSHYNWIVEEIKECTSCDSIIDPVFHLGEKLSKILA